MVLISAAIQDLFSGIRHLKISVDVSNNNGVAASSGFGAQYTCVSFSFPSEQKAALPVLGLGHVLHVAAPGPLVKVPIVHREQKDAPSCSVKYPMGHSRQVRSCKYDPASHVIDVQFVAPAPLVKVLAAHGEQNDAPSCAVK